MPSARKIVRFLLPWAMLLPIGVGLALLERYLRHSAPTQPPHPEIVWVFAPQHPGAIASSPLVADHRVYVGVIRDAGLQPMGAVCALDEQTGKQIWRSDANGEMLHMFSSPCLADGLIYIGEGMHANFDCKLTCLEASSGHIRWRFPATSHIESSPCVDGGRVYCGAGDDGLYALDAQSGKKIWQFDEQLHIDSSPTVSNGIVYVGSGVSRRYHVNELLALATDSGKPVWRVRVDLPAWGSPVVDAGQVFFGLGNGRLEQSDPVPAGSVFCLDAKTGKEIWRCRLPDAVYSRVSLDRSRVYVGCRDGNVYAVERDSGHVAWRCNAGSGVVTTPALHEGRLYVAANAGRLLCIDAESGRELEAFDLAEHTKAKCRLWSSPVVDKDSDGRSRVYFGAEIRFPDHSEANLLCLRF
jgi:outer membrane protein assembly factor BamB